MSFLLDHHRLLIPVPEYNQLLTDDQDKAQALSNQFESVFTRENKDVPNSVDDWKSLP